MNSYDGWFPTPKRFCIRCGKENDDILFFFLICAACRDEEHKAHNPNPYEQEDEDAEYIKRINDPRGE
jgi:hypothetical protein